MTMLARALAGSEAEIWRRLRLEALTHYPDAFLTTVAETEALPVDEIAARLDQGNTFGIFQDGPCVGIGSLIPLRYAKCAHRAEIGAFYVAPHAHGTGAGSALLKGLIARALDLGRWQVELYVADTNTHAKRLYARHGFEPVGRLPNAIFENGGYIDDVFMVRDCR